jgi:hypothetical protein
MEAYFLDNSPHHLSGVPPDFVRHPAQIDMHGSQPFAGLRPRPPSCPLERPSGANSAVGRSRAAQSDMTSIQRSRPRQVVGPRCSTCIRIDAQASASSDTDILGDLDFPFPFAHAAINRSVVGRIVRRDDEADAGPLSPLLHPPRPHAARSIATRVRAFRTDKGWPPSLGISGQLRRKAQLPPPGHAGFI